MLNRLLADRELVHLARGGSREAFEALVRRYQKAIYFLCLRYVRDHDLAADVTQRTFIRAIENLAELRDPELFRGWLFRIGVNLALNQLREQARFESRSRSASPGGPDSPAEETTPGPAAVVESIDESRVLQRAVSRLPRRQRRIVELRVYQELPFSEIAVELATTANAAKVSYHHAVKKLRELLAA
jgi:RNA polymerase sigma-70 factor (ECF subfamily)